MRSRPILSHVRYGYCYLTRRLTTLREELTDEKFNQFWQKIQCSQSSNYHLLDLKSKHSECLTHIRQLTELISCQETKEEKEIARLATSELEALVEQKFQIEESIVLTCLPPEEFELDCQQGLVLSAIPGAGGQEASLFAKELFSMYQNYAALKQWSFEITEMGNSDLGGINFAAAKIIGAEAFRSLRFESGVHRVQRIPVTERGGRIHTSTASITISPLPNEINIVIPPKDLRKEVFKASGHGGQNLQKTESAVRLTHLPTRLFAECQQERSQLSNFETAMKRLQSKLYELEFEKQYGRIEKSRKLQMGTKGRSEKIRTYNFNDKRVSDHRIKRHFYPVEEVLRGGDAFAAIVDALLEFNRNERILELLNCNDEKRTVCQGAD